MTSPINKIIYTYENNFFLNILILFEDSLVLFFDGVDFVVKEQSDIVNISKYKELNYQFKGKGIFVNEIKRDNTRTFFIQLSNKDILLISISMIGNEPQQSIQIFEYERRCFSRSNSIYQKVLLSFKAASQLNILTS